MYLIGKPKFLFLFLCDFLRIEVRFYSLNVDKEKFHVFGNFTERFKCSSPKDFEFGKVFLSLNILCNPFLLFCFCEVLMNMMFGLKFEFDFGYMMLLSF